MYGQALADGEARILNGNVVIIGGGVIGSAVAAFLAAEPGFAGRTIVIERDLTYRTASSALSASSIRQQFSTPVNIAISRFGIGFLRDIGRRLAIEDDPAAAPDVGLREPGYLYVATAAGMPIIEANHRVQREQDVDVALLDPGALAARFPWLAVDDLAMGSLGLSGEGWFDGYALLQAFRRKARSLGVRYLADETVALDRRGGRIEGVRLASGETLPAGAVVNAAGPWAAKVAAMADLDLPVRGRRRSVFVFDCRESLPGCPLVIDTSGVWFRPEGAHFICGMSPAEGEEDPDDVPLEVEHHLFEEAIWPALARRVPAFEAVKVLSSWAGYYDYNVFDQNGIVGRDPDIENLYVANGFSGHGLQQSPAVGRAVAELIAHGAYRTLDLSPLGPERIRAGRPLRELCVI